MPELPNETAPNNAVTDALANHAKSGPKPRSLVGEPYKVPGKNKSTVDGNAIPDADPLTRYTFSDGSTIDLTAAGGIAAQKAGPVVKAGDKAEWKEDGTGQWWVENPDDPAHPIKIDGPKGKPSAVTPEAAAADAAKDKSALRDLSEDERQKAYNLERYGLWLNHVDMTKYQQNKDANSRQNAATAAAAELVEWGRKDAAKKALVDARKADVDAHKPQIETVDGLEVTKFWDTDKQEYVVPAGLTGSPPKGHIIVGDNTTSARVLVYDAQGKLISDDPNKAFMPSAPTQVATDTISPFIHQMVQGQDGKWTMQKVENTNRLTVEQSLIGKLYPQLADLYKEGKIGLKEATDIMSAAGTATKDKLAEDQAAATAARDDLAALNTAATTGAGILKDRAANANSQMNNWVNAIGSNKNIGLGSQLSDSWGSNLVGGIGAWTTEMAGGQGVIDRATAAVNAIDPDHPNAAPSHATLLKMQQHMGVAVPGSNPQTVATNTPLTGNRPPAAPGAPVVAPVAPVAPQPPDWQRADQPLVTAAPLNPVTGLPVAGVTGTVGTNDPRRLSPPKFTPPQFPGRGMQWG